MARNDMNDDWGFEDEVEAPQPRPRIQPKYGNGGNQQPRMRGLGPEEQMGYDRSQGGNNGYQQGYNNQYEQDYNNQGYNNYDQRPLDPYSQGQQGYQQGQQVGDNGDANGNGGKGAEKEKKTKSGFKKFLTFFITLLLVVVLLFVAIKLVKGSSTPKKSTKDNQTTQTTKKKTTEKVVEDSADSTSGTKEESKKKETIADVGGIKDSSAKEKIDTKSIESEVYSNTATVKTVELITTGKLTASYHFVFEMGSTHLDMYLNEFEAENLKVGDKVKISFKKIPSKDKVVITDIQRA
jgi:hypothetical protein